MAKNYHPNTIEHKSFQLNGYTVKWSKIYEKWQVCKSKIVYEEFNDATDARSFIKNL